MTHKKKAVLHIQGFSEHEDTFRDDNPILQSYATCLLACVRQAPNYLQKAKSKWL